MKIEFMYSEVMTFIGINSLFNKTIEDRVNFLIECGVIDSESPSESVQQKYNKVIYDETVFSILIKNSFWEEVIKNITGNNIVILDHKDDTINGVCCDACGYIVFEDKEDSFYEICPVCAWQNDGRLGDEYSSCNHGTMDDFKKGKDFNEKLELGSKKYIR
ncbi:CPCC family cysteine-rich protein [Pectobacterium parmentieri]|uniref:CPCC family cysteine-rich protein n=1 Tax=Pectobacterium parmentieri TaxID=1905730 RepID=UPI00047377D3|nr:CPCC family cysteine-rich protein [Pectobacterium parmentieri]PWD56527.1 hypothetical protein DF211_22445 [Pectobacterium parmentieri]